MDLPVELVGLLMHAGVDGNKLTWDLQVNSSAISVKLMWIKAEKPVEKTGQVTSQAQKKKHLSPSIRKRNAQRINQWKAKRNEAVGHSKICAQAQTDDSNSITDETTQTEQLHSDEQALHKPTALTQIRERSTQTRSTFTGRQLTPTKYLDTEESRKPWKKCTAVRSPYIRGKLSYMTEFKDGSVSFSESFDPDDPVLIDRYPDYTAETDLGDRPPTPTQQRDENSKRQASKEKTNLSAIPDKVSRT
jgi:hypothetical protein